MSPILFWGYFLPSFFGYSISLDEISIRSEKSIHLIADFQADIGCSVDWDINCAITEFNQDGYLYHLGLRVPAGTWNFKIHDKGVYYGRNQLKDGTPWTIKLITAANFLFEYSATEHKLNFQMVTDLLESRSMPPLPTITLTDTLIFDPNGNMTANPADSIRYTIILRNETGQSILNAVINHSGDPNVTYNPNSLKASPLAFNDTLQFLVNPMVLSTPGILNNDFDLNDPLPNPPFNFNLFVHRVESNQTSVGNTITTSAGGMIMLNMDGSLTYDSTGINGAVEDSIHYTIRDVDGYEDSANIYIQFNLPPVIASNLAITDTICAFEQQDTFVMSTTFTIMDDELNSESAKIEICNNYLASEDTLIAGPLPGGITASWTDGTGTLMLMGSATLADYKTAIESIQYINQSDNPVTSIRTICITVNDGSLNSNQVNRLLQIKPLNDCPLAVRDTFVVDENASFPASNVLTNDLDPDLDILSVTPVINEIIVGGTASAFGAGGFSFMHTTGLMSLDTLNLGEMFFARMKYTVSDGLCMDSDTVIIKVIGTNDAPVADSNLYVASQASILSVAAPGLLADDYDIDHASTIMIGTVKGTPGNVGSPVTLPSGAELTVYADGSFTYNPNCLVNGLDTFTYQIKDDNDSLSNAALVYINVHQVMWFVADTAGTTGTGSFDSPFDQLSDAEAASSPGDYIFVFQGIYTENITLKNDQKFLGADENWNCPIGSMIRTADGTSVINGTITLAQNDTIRGIELGNNVASMPMMVDNGSSVLNLVVSNTNINTTSSSGFKIVNGGALNVTFDAFNSTSTTAEAIYLNNTSGSVTVSGGNINTGSGYGKTIVTVIGGTISLDIRSSISQPNNFPLVSVSGGHAIGTITFQAGILNATFGSGLLFDNADGTYNFNGTNSLSGGDAGVDILNGSSGTFSFATTSSISNPSGTGFNINNSPANVTYSGSISKSSAGFAIDVSDHDAGTVTFEAGSINSSGSSAGLRVINNDGGIVNFNNPTKILNTPTHTAVTLQSNTGSTMNFGSGGLVITTSLDTGFHASGGGTINVTGTGNTINSSAATALLVFKTTIGSGNLNFQSISSGSSAGTGIILIGTGTLGGLTVTGTGTAASGGTISDKTGMNADTLTGVGIFLSNCMNVVLNNMQLNNFENFGILGYEVNGLSMDSVVVNHNAGKNGTNGLEGSVSFGRSDVVRNGLTGIVSITNCKIEDGYLNNLHVVNWSGNLTQLNLTNDTIQDNSSIVGNDGLKIEVRGDANVTADVSGCFFLRNASFGATIGNYGTGTVDVEFKNSTSFTNNGSGIGLLLDNSSGDLNFDIISCMFSVPGLSSAFESINCQLGTSSTFSSLFSGNITNNTIDNNNSANSSGIYVRTQGTGTFTSVINNNAFSKIARDGIEVQNFGNGTLNAIVTGNNINLNSLCRYGISMQAGLSVGDLSSICTQIGGVFAEKNVINLNGMGVADIRINKIATATFNIKGLTPTPATAADVIAYLPGQNTLLYPGPVSAAGSSFMSCIPPFPFFTSNSLKK